MEYTNFVCVGRLQEPQTHFLPFAVRRSAQSGRGTFEFVSNRCHSRNRHALPRRRRGALLTEWSFEKQHLLAWHNKFPDSSTPKPFSLSCAGPGAKHTQRNSDRFTNRFCEALKNVDWIHYFCSTVQVWSTKGTKLLPSFLSQLLECQTIPMTHACPLTCYSNKRMRNLLIIPRGMK